MENLVHPSQLPSVDRIMQSDSFISLSESYGRDTVLIEVRSKLDQARTRLTNRNNSKGVEKKPEKPNGVPDKTGDSKAPVSYTHLTLPTICSV